MTAILKGISIDVRCKIASIMMGTDDVLDMLYQIQDYLVKNPSLESIPACAIVQSLFYSLSFVRWYEIHRAFSDPKQPA